MIFFRITSYLEYILKAAGRRGHGIHSPFLFDLIGRVIRNKPDPSFVLSIESIRQRLKKDKRIIATEYPGAGSDGSAGKPEKVSSVARRSSLPEKYGKLLSNMAAEFGDPLIIEFGTSFGFSTMYMALACRSTRVLTIEGSSSRAVIAEDNFRELALDNIEVVIGTFDDVLQDLERKGVRPGLVFIDGNHRKDPVLKYFRAMAGLADEKTVIILDDINYSTGMAEAWEEIKRCDKVTLTVDLYRMGMVFFRKGAQCKDYILRY